MARLAVPRGGDGGRQTLSVMEFEGRVALVTGGASGIGRACAAELARGGADLVVVDYAAEAALAQAENLLKAAGGRVLSFRADVSEHARAAQVVEETTARALTSSERRSTSGVRMKPGETALTETP